VLTRIEGGVLTGFEGGALAGFATAVLVLGVAVGGMTTLTSQDPPLSILIIVGLLAAGVRVGVAAGKISSSSSVSSKETNFARHEQILAERAQQKQLLKMAKTAALMECEH